jgi:DNA-binding NarL/FixJ family response regulator
MAASVSVASRVLIIEDHQLVRESLVRVLGTEQDFTVVAEAGGPDEGLALARALQPDIVLSDVSMPGGTGLELATRLRQASPRSRLVFLTVHDDESTVAHAISVGADGYLLKTGSMAELLQGLRAVASGGSFLAPAVARSVMRRAGGQSPAVLTNRELEILRLLADGSRPAEVAAKLFVSPKTVRNHLASVYVKLGVATAAQAIGEAFRRGLVSRAH